MKTIYFSQFANLADPPIINEIYWHASGNIALIKLSNCYDEPVDTLIKKWQRLLEYSGYSYYVTWYEHPLLMAQHLHRSKQIEFKFIEVSFDSNQKIHFRTIELDDDGNLCDDVVGGFFCERLKFLR